MRRRQWLSCVGAFGTAWAITPLLPSRALAGACAPSVRFDAYLSPPDARIPSDGGIVLGSDQGYRDGRSALFEGPYVIVHEGGETAATIRVVAPGLALVRVPPSLRGRVTVRGPAGERGFELLGQPGARLAPPHLRRVAQTRFEGRQQPYSPGGWYVTAQLEAPVPPGVVGAIVFPAGGPSAGGFAPATPGQRSIQLHHSPGRCQAGIPNENPPSPGSIVRIAYVDATGRISVQSNHVEVRE